MTLTGSAYWVLLLSGALCPGSGAGGETPNATESGEDLSAAGTASDYSKQFGTVRGSPTFLQPPTYHPYLPLQGNRPIWSPVQVHRPIIGDIGAPEAAIDPYVLYLFARYSRFLPGGIGLYGIYGSTGLPTPKPPGVFSVPAVIGSSGEYGELRFVAVVYRHGDRAPITIYPNDPYHSDTCWPNGWGQLTNLGKLQQFELGKWLRTRYCHFLPVNYHPRDIYVLSSDSDRTLVSAYSNLAGLYESWMKENKLKDLEWIAIPVHSVPRELDPLLAAAKPCPLFNTIHEAALRTEEVELVNEYYRDLFQTVSECSGLNVTSIQDIPRLYSTLHVESLHGFELPSWTKDYYPEPLKEITEFVFRLPCSTIPLKRLKCGPLLKDILLRMECKKNGSITQRMWMYSGHDTTLANLMQCLNVYDGALPPYTAALLFELYRKSNDWYLVVSYKTPTTLQVLRVPQCERLCSLSSFKKLVKPVIPVDWEEECKRPTDDRCPHS